MSIKVLKPGKFTDGWERLYPRQIQKFQIGVARTLASWVDQTI